MAFEQWTAENIGIPANDNIPARLRRTPI